MSITEAQLQQIEAQCADAMQQLLQVAKVPAGGIVVVGCSTSEVLGSRIGTDSSPAVAQALYRALDGVLRPRGLYLAVQCCEHLNRALVVEREALPMADIVNVVPQPKAGGSLATAAYQGFEHPIVVESLRADAGMDIGDTLIGMHLRPVAVPVRIQTKAIGQARVVCARTRPKFVGGARAVYNDDLL